MPDDQSQQPASVHIPDFIVRQVGTLQLQLAAANEQIGQLQQELTALKATKPEPSTES